MSCRLKSDSSLEISFGAKSEGSSSYGVLNLPRLEK
ncbi:hypothetical protein SOVF_208460, partial [Spinacia oleracea]